MQMRTICIDDGIDDFAQRHTEKINVCYKEQIQSSSSSSTLTNHMEEIEEFHDTD